MVTKESQEYQYYVAIKGFCLVSNFIAFSSALYLRFFFFLGGFGVAKNLCSWAVDGKNCTVNEHVNSTLQAFHSAKKPIGLCCISPVLAAKVFPGCEVTVGQDKNVDGR